LNIGIAAMWVNEREVRSAGRYIALRIWKLRRAIRGGKSYGLRGISFRGFRGINDVPCVELESSRDEDRAELGKEQEEVL